MQPKSVLQIQCAILVADTGQFKWNGHTKLVVPGSLWLVCVSTGYHGGEVYGWYMGSVCSKQTIILCMCLQLISYIAMKRAGSQPSSKKRRVTFTTYKKWARNAVLQNWRNFY